MLDFVFSNHGKKNNFKLRPSDNKRKNQKKPRMDLDCFITEKIMRRNVKTEENQPENITNLNNCQKSNSNNLTLDLSFEDLNNIIINKHLQLEKSSLKLNTEFNNDNNCSSINQNEINSTEQKNHFGPSINIDEESKSYIKDIIDNCKGKKSNYLIMDKNKKNNRFNYIRTKPNININLKEINLKKENYKDNGHIKRLKTEDLIEIAKRRKEHLNRKRNNKKDEDSFKINDIKTEQNRKLIIDTEFNEENCLSKKNKTNRINIKEEYFSSFLKSNKTQANLINNNINNIKKNLSINNRIKISNNAIKNHLFNLYKEKNKNYFNNQNNYEKNNNVKKLIQTKSGLNNTRKFISIFSNDFNKVKKYNNLNRRNQITLKKDFFFNNQDSLNFLFQTNNSIEKVILENNISKKKGILNNNTNINSKSKKYNFFNYKLYNNNNIKNKNILLKKIKNNSTNLINVLNKKNNSRFNNYNEKKKNLIIDSSSKNKQSNKSANYLSTNIQHNFQCKKDEQNLKNKNRPSTIFQKLLNTDKGNQKDKKIYNTLISNEIYGKGFYKNSIQNKSENILNIKELKLKANSSVRVKKNDINNNNNNYTYTTNNNVINSKNLKTSNILKFNKNIRTYKNISLQNNSINYLYQKKGVILNNKLFLNYSPIKMNNNDCYNYSKISLKNIKYKTSFNNKKMASNEQNDDIMSPKRKSENKENVQSLNIIKEVSDLKEKNSEINYIKKMDINNNKNIFKKIGNEPSNYKELIHKKNLYKKINCNNIKYEKNKKILNKKFSYNNNTLNI